VTNSRWARLTWQAADPGTLAASLVRRIGVAAQPGDDGIWRLDLGAETLEVVPWRREGPDDEPNADGRLVFEPIDGGGPPPEPVPDAPITLVAVAWSTVELDRAEDELGPWLVEADPSQGDGDAPADPHLGAQTRIRRTKALPGGRLVLAEPGTEGRLAAALARDSEGPCALYVRVAAGLDAWVEEARARHVQVSARRPGPLGQAVLLPGRSMAGPHILVVDGR
jgi:hypothetical protein